MKTLWSWQFRWRFDRRRQSHARWSKGCRKGLGRELDLSLTFGLDQETRGVTGGPPIIKTIVDKNCAPRRQRKAFSRPLLVRGSRTAAIGLDRNLSEGIAATSAPSLRCLADRIVNRDECGRFDTAAAPTVVT